MSNQNLYCHFLANGFSNPDALLLKSRDGVEYSYSDADRHSSRIACFLTHIGLQAGDRVTVQVAKTPESLWLYLACLKAGFVYHPLNTAYQANELRYFLGDAAPSLVVCDSSNLANVQTLTEKAGVQAIHTLNADGSGSLIAESNKHISDSEPFTPVHRSADDLAVLLYSSGTTGQPKGIMLSHCNLYDNAATLTKYWEFSAYDRLLHALPIFHVHGLFVALGCVFLSGASMLWLPGFNTADLLRFLPECTTFMGVPTYYTRLLGDEKFGRQHCTNARVFFSGSAPLLEATFSDFRDRTGHTILERYGMTETGMNTSNPLHGDRKPGTVGQPLPGVSLRVVDDQGLIVATGETGNVQVKGPNVFQGYWKRPDKTADDFTSDGFFNTGDQGMMDQDGYLTLVGRSKDMIISGGLNIFPKEIELVLDSQAGIIESAVIGVPHPDFGEAVVAVLVQAADGVQTEQSIIEAIRQELANFKVPKKVFMMDELPRNAMGKVQKNRLRERYIDCCQPVSSHLS